MYVDPPVFIENEGEVNVIEGKLIVIVIVFELKTLLKPCAFV
jgi:hypothetical protein